MNAHGVLMLWSLTSAHAESPLGAVLQSAALGGVISSIVPSDPPEPTHLNTRTFGTEPPVTKSLSTRTSPTLCVPVTVVPLSAMSFCVNQKPTCESPLLS